MLLQQIKSRSLNSGYVHLYGLYLKKKKKKNCFQVLLLIMLLIEFIVQMWKEITFREDASINSIKGVCVWVCVCKNK